MEQFHQQSKTERAPKTEEDKYGSIFKNAIEGIFQTTKEGQYIRVNPALARIYGYSSPEELLQAQPNLNKKLYIDPNERKRFQAEIEKQGVVDNFEAQVRKLDGSVIWITETARGVYDRNGNFLYYEGFVKDISDRKQIEADLKLAKEAAETANKAKSNFIANMSHELRTPLNAIIGFAQLMARSDHLIPEHQEDVNIIIRSGEHLLNLINNVLDLSKIEAGSITLNEKNIDLCRLLDDLQNMFALPCQEKDLQLLLKRSPDVPSYIRTDELKLRQVLINLLSNAVKFGNSGIISLTVEHSNVQSNLLTFSVEDNGPGIAPEEIDKIFEPFVQSQTGKQAQEGTGLGLAICRKFVEIMGGQISVASEIGKGSIFTFDISYNLVDKSDITKQKTKKRVIALEANQMQYRILIVDDKPYNRLLLIKLLSPLGFAVKEATNGQEAIAIFHEWEPHLIWMDMRMPVMDGYEATKQIKSTLSGQATAVIALTASVLDEERMVILSLGCDDFLRKPFREEEIFAMMNKHLGVRYVYEDQNLTTQITGANLLTTAELQKLPEKTLTNLKQAIEIVDLDEITNILEEIKEENYRLALDIQDAIDNFEYDQILNLLS